MNIEIVGPIFSNHSLAIVNRALAKGLSKYNLNVTITPTDEFSPDYKVDTALIMELSTKINVDIGKIDLQIRHSYPPMWQYPVDKDTKVCFIQPWEYSKVPSEWAYKFDSFADAVITPSAWTADKYKNAGIDPEKVYVVPNGYNPDTFNKNNRKFANSILPHERFTFTFVGCGQFRKGLDILLNVWKSAFVAADKVQLIVKDTPAIYGQSNLLDEIIKMQYKTNCGSIVYNDDQLSNEEMATLYQNTDVIVHPYRGEGFGMHIQEAVACGAFPLTTANGPVDEFIPYEAGWKINTRQAMIDLTRPEVFAIKPGDSLSNMGQHGWVLEPDPQDLHSKMQMIYYSHDKSTLFAMPEKAKLNTWDSVLEHYVAVFTQLNASKTPRRYR